ncbi:efflux RND transporter permease subunit [Pseudoalteromonas rubra]|uniref:efflux RND transporter permease subunit n=1 Tax=Pseudoalteromonas rubra TaxID=43658 RepID=UPI000F7737DB|nr:efflux RND transporter permease subunit [Pseudoalteromonas rubra]
MTERFSIIAWFAKNPVAANLLMLAVILLGLSSAGSLRKEGFPQQDPDTVQISVAYPSGSAAQAEQGIAIAIENALESVKGIKRVTTTASASSVQVLVEKTSQHDLDTLQRDIKNQVDAIYNLPEDTEKPVITTAQREQEVIRVQLFGELSTQTLQTLGSQLADDLLAQPNIATLNQNDHRDPLVAIEIDEARLQAYQLSFSDVAEAINQYSGTALTTSLRNPDKVLRLKAAEQALYASDFASIVVATTAAGKSIRLSDVATLQDTFADDSFHLARFNGHPTYGITIVMDEYGDMSKSVAQAKAVVAKWQSKLPEGASLITWYDNSKLITERLSLLSLNALSGIALVFMVLALFLNLKVAFWVAAGLPFVFFGSLYFMTEPYTGMTLNEMTTFGFIMALGIVVDDAVVVGESIYTTRKRFGDTLSNTIKGTHLVAVPTLFGVLTTVAAFAALANISGGLGVLYAQFGTVVTLCLLLSVVESKLILPAHLAHIRTRQKPQQQPNRIAVLWHRVQQKADGLLTGFNQRLYKPALERVMHFRYAALMGFVALFFLAISLITQGMVRVGFFPGLPADTITATMTLYNDASFGQTARNLDQLEAQLYQAEQQLLDEQNVSHIASVSVSATGDQSGTLNVELAGTQPYTLSELAKRWRAIAGTPEASKTLHIQAQLARVSNFKVELKSTSDETLEAAEATLQQALRDISGVHSIDSSLAPGEATMRFEVTEEGEMRGFTTQLLARQLLQAFGGEVVQRYMRNKDEVKVRVRYPLDERSEQGDVLAARVRAPGGRTVPLGNVAKVIYTSEVQSITRINGVRAITVSAAVNKTQLTPTELVAQLERSVVPELRAQYPDLTLHFAGEAEHQKEATDSMSSAYLLALLAIYALLAIPLKSYWQPLIIMSVIPFGFVGAILGHWGLGLTLSILSLNGILALSGVVINDSLLLVSQFNRYRNEGKTMQNALLEACTGRLRAILLTSLTTFAGLYPILGETSQQAQFLIPAAASLGYGILFATAITLFLIPVLLLISHDIANLMSRFSPTRTEHVPNDQRHFS